MKKECMYIYSYLSIKINYNLYAVLFVQYGKIYNLNKIKCHGEAWEVLYIILRPALLKFKYNSLNKKYS